MTTTSPNTALNKALRGCHQHSHIQATQGQRHTACTANPQPADLNDRLPRSQAVVDLDCLAGMANIATFDAVSVS